MDLHFINALRFSFIKLLPSMVGLFVAVYSFTLSKRVRGGEWLQCSNNPIWSGWRYFALSLEGFASAKLLSSERKITSTTINVFNLVARWKHMCIIAKGEPNSICIPRISCGNMREIDPYFRCQYHRVTVIFRRINLLLSEN